MLPSDTIVYIYQENLIEETELRFLDILLDETCIYGTIYVPHACFSKVATPNHRLPDKQVYEFLLRLACEFPIQLTTQVPVNADNYRTYCSYEVPLSIESLQVDCYMLSRYKKILLENNLFDAASASIVEVAQYYSIQDTILPYLADMLQEKENYLYYYLGSQPFLIYKGDNVCYNILTIFAEKLGEALENNGCLVTYFDLSIERPTAAVRFINQRFQAVIGIQSYMFSIQLDNQELLHDSIVGPKYNFLFDHPVRFSMHLTQVPQNFTLLTLDKDYAEFAQKYYHIDAFCLPPGGINVTFASEEERIYDLTFVGTYFNNAKEISQEIQTLNRSQRFLLNRLWLNMRKFPELPAEESLKLALKYYQIQLSDSDFLELFTSMRRFVLYMATRYRNKILETILKAGIKLDVFGTSWADSPLRAYPNFIWHNRDLTTDEALEVWQQSKIALNIMSWHKNAITERILNSMLQKAVVLTERNPYMEEAFIEGTDILYYDLSNLNALPNMIHNHLDNTSTLYNIAQNGYQKALSMHTWDIRAKQLHQLTEET